MITLYSVWKNKVGEERLFVMRKSEDGVIAVSLENKKPTIKEITLLCLENMYTNVSESVGNFLSLALKLYGAADTTRQLIFSVENSSHPTLKDIIMARKAPAAKKTAAKKTATKKIVAKKEDVTETPTVKAEKVSDVSGTKIKLLVKDNPKREGTSSYDRFELYKTSKTIEDFIACGGRRADIAYDSKKGFIQLS